jgi:hypothetical protein
MGKPDQLIIVSEILGGNPSEDAEGAYLDVRGTDKRVTRIAMRQRDLQLMEFAFGDLRGLTAQARKKAGKDDGLVEVTVQTVDRLKVNPDFARGQIAIELVHMNTRSTHISLTLPQIEDLQRLIDGAKADLAAHQKPN